MGEGRALEVVDGTDLLGTVLSLLLRDDVQTLALKLGDHGLIVAQIGLGADEQDGHAGSVVLDLGPPLGLDVVEGVGRNDGEGDEEDVL